MGTKMKKVWSWVKDHKVELTVGIAAGVVTVIAGKSYVRAMKSHRVMTDLANNEPFMLWLQDSVRCTDANPCQYWWAAAGDEPYITTIADLNNLGDTICKHHPEVKLDTVVTGAMVYFK